MAPRAETRQWTTNYGQAYIVAEMGRSRQGYWVRRRDSDVRRRAGGRADSAAAGDARRSPGVSLHSLSTAPRLPPTMGDRAWRKPSSSRPRCHSGIPSPRMTPNISVLSRGRCTVDAAPASFAFRNSLRGAVKKRAGAVFAFCSVFGLLSGSRGTLLDFDGDCGAWVVRKTMIRRMDCATVPRRRAGRSPHGLPCKQDRPAVRPTPRS